MKTYPTVRIRDVAQFLKGKKPSITYDKVTNNAVPHILIENFGGRYTSYTDDQGCVHCERNDTIIVADGASTGLVSTNHEGCIGSTLGALRPRQSKINPRYLYFFTQSNFTTLNTRTRGAAIPHIERELLLNLEFTLPPLVEQERIVRLLDEADTLRRLRGQADQRTAAVEVALFREMFGAPALNPFGWHVESIGELFDENRNGVKCGPFGSALKKEEYTGSGIPVWGIPNVLPNKFVETDSLFISQSKFNELQAYSVKPGDLLISRAGTVGRICVARPQAPESIIGTNLIRLTLDRSRVVPEFFSTLMTYFASEVGQLRTDTNETSYSFMNTSVLRSLQIYLPPVDLQELFTARVAEISALQTGQAASHQNLEDLFQSLLYRAFQGEL